MITYVSKEYNLGPGDKIRYIWSLKGPIFSSPEHEVLMVSYCDQSMSVVRRPSSVVNNLF